MYKSFSSSLAFFFGSAKQAQRFAQLLVLIAVVSISLVFTTKTVHNTFAPAEHSSPGIGSFIKIQSVDLQSVNVQLAQQFATNRYLLEASTTQQNVNGFSLSLKTSNTVYVMELNFAALNV